MASTVHIIGGGLGALSGAIHLACRGFQVELFEQNRQLGGKMGEIWMGPYRFDTGPSLLTMPEVIEDLFQVAGCDSTDFFQMIPLSRLCRYFFADGSLLDASVDEAQMQAAIAALCPEDAQAYPSFLQYTRRIYELTQDTFLRTPIHELRQLCRLRHLPTLLRLSQIDPFRTMHGAITQHFSDPRMIQLFDRYATYSGSDPFQAPATLNIIPYVEYGLGGYYIQGGMYRLVEALAQVAQQQGVVIHLGARVEKILVTAGHVRGVSVDGEEYGADYVLCGADVVTTYNSLLDGLESEAESLNRLEPSLSGMVFLWGVNREFARLEHHNILFSADYRGEFQRIFQEQHVPDEPTVYVAITSKRDPGHAPAGCENWFVLLNMPYLTEDQDWELETKWMRQAVLARLQAVGVDVAPHIEVEHILTPRDFQELYGSNRGSIYGISSNARSTAFKRPPNRCRHVKGLYFAGGSSHPGGGIPLVLLSGKIASKLVMDAEGRA